jgi:hypothetical protein
VTCTRFYRRVSYKGRFDQLARWCRHGQRTICSHRRARGAWALADNLRLIIPASRRNKTAKPDDHPARKVKTPFPVLSFFGRGSRELWLDGSVLWDVTARRDVSIQICWSRPLHCTVLYCCARQAKESLQLRALLPASMFRSHTQKESLPPVVFSTSTAGRLAYSQKLRGR